MASAAREFEIHLARAFLAQARAFRIREQSHHFHECFSASLLGMAARARRRAMATGRGPEPEPEQAELF